MRRMAQYLGFITNPKNGRVKALSKACLDRTYLRNAPPKKGGVFFWSIFYENNRCACFAW